MSLEVLSYDVCIKVLANVAHLFSIERQRNENEGLGDYNFCMDNYQVMCYLVVNILLGLHCNVSFQTHFIYCL